MLHSDLYINFVPKPCTNFKIYYYGEAESTEKPSLPSYPNKYITDIEKLSDLPKDITSDCIHIEWEYAKETIPCNDKELTADMDKLITYYMDGNHLIRGDIDLAPLFIFSQKYGMFSIKKAWGFSLDDNSVVLEEVAHHMASLGIIRGIQSHDLPMRKFLPWLYNSLNQSVKDYVVKTGRRGNTFYSVYTPYGFVVEGTNVKETTRGLYLRIPFNKGFKENMKEDYEDMKEDPEFVPDLFLRDLREYALSSVMHYLSRNGLIYSTNLDANKITFSITIHSPTTYYLLLNTRPVNFDKRMYDIEYSKKPYPKLTSYFRTQYIRNIITKSQYIFAKEKAKELCLESAYRYEEAKKIIQDYLKEGV